MKTPLDYNRTALSHFYLYHTIYVKSIVPTSLWKQISFADEVPLHRKPIMHNLRLSIKMFALQNSSASLEAHKFQKWLRGSESNKCICLWNINRSEHEMSKQWNRLSYLWIPLAVSPMPKERIDERYAEWREIKTQKTVLRRQLCKNCEIYANIMWLTAVK